MTIAEKLINEGKDIQEVMNLTGLERDKLLKIQRQAFK